MGRGAVASSAARPPIWARMRSPPGLDVIAADLFPREPGSLDHQDLDAQRSEFPCKRGAGRPPSGDDDIVSMRFSPRRRRPRVS